MNRLLRVAALLALWAGAVGAQEMYYVIKVTPTLVYLDAGSAAGVRMGDRYLVVSRASAEDPYAPVAEVSVVRVDEAFSIAEVLSCVEGKRLEVLQRAISAKDWELMAPTVEPAAPVAAPPAEPSLAELDAPEAGPAAPGERVWSLSVVGGGEWRKGFRLRGATVERIGDVAAGLRLSRVWGGCWRVSMGGGVAGATLGASSADIDQLATEIGLHYLLRGASRPGPYLGVGLGMNRLSWQSPAGDESALKSGAALVAGLHLPLGGGAWLLQLESGYQRVLKWDDRIDASNLRTYAGVGRAW